MSDSNANILYMVGVPRHDTITGNHVVRVGATNVNAAILKARTLLVRDGFIPANHEIRHIARTAAIELRDGDSLAAADKRAAMQVLVALRDS